MGTYEKWDQELELLLWLPTIFNNKADSLTLEVLNENISSIPHIQHTKYYKTIMQHKLKEEGVKLDETHVEFLEALANVKQEINQYLTKKYCLVKSKLDDSKLLKIIWLTANQLLRAPERQNSVNEVIRINLKTIGRENA